MKAQIINGRELAEEVIVNLQSKKLSIKPGLISIVIGGDKLAHKFADLKGEKTRLLGWSFEKKSFPESFSPAKIIEYIHEKNSDNKVHGIVIQLPLPPNFETHRLLKTVHPYKDIDGLHPKNMGLLIEGHPVIIPPVVLAVLEVIRSVKEYPVKQFSYNEDKFSIEIPDLKGIGVCLVGGGVLVGKPLFSFLINQGASVSLINEFTKSKNDYTRSAEIIITGTNQKNVLAPNDVSDGTIVIDVGNDINPEDFYENEIFLSKNPGGVGPLTVAYLMRNLSEGVQFSASPGDSAEN